MEYVYRSCRLEVNGIPPNDFSKKLANLKAALALRFAYYNFCRIHQTLRVTPAITAGVTSRVWGLEELMTC